MVHNIPYARLDVGSPKVEAVVEWLGVNELLNVLAQLPPEKEFSILLDFLVEFAGGLELAQQMTEKYERTWGWMGDPPLRRPWEHLLEETLC